MSIEVFMNEAEQNAINFRWSEWSTNLFALWSPEVYIFEDDADRFWVRENIGWHMENGSLVSPTLEVSHNDYSFVWKASLTPVGDTVEISYELTNTGNKPLPEMFHINSCFNTKTAPDFMDSTGDRTFFRSSDGWTSLADVRREQSLWDGHDPYHILVEGGPESDGEEVVRSVKSVGSFIVREQLRGQAVVALAWESSLRVDVNFNRLNCIHSNASWGSPAPGQTLTRKGRIYFHKGSKEELLEQCRKDGFAE